MRFEGNELRAILKHQAEPVEVRDGYCRTEGCYQDARRALALVTRGQYYGIGNKRRIRFVQVESVEDRTEPWGLVLRDVGMPKGIVAPRVSSNVTPRGAKHWKLRPERAHTGYGGSVRQMQFGQ